MSEKKLVSYEDGHKRETRKSYQTFLEELMSDPNEEASGSAAESDDASVRRSKRTPIPKRSFKLIDDYASKEPCKKKFKDENESELKSEIESVDNIQEVTIKTELEDEEEVNSVNSIINENKDDSLKKNKTVEEREEEVNDDDDQPDESSAPRKSGRSRKPKTFEDSITPIKRQIRKTNEPINTGLSPSEADVFKTKVLAKLTAHANTQIKEEKIIGKDNEEYVYRNVFVTEILDSTRRRSCTLSKNKDKGKEPAKPESVKPVSVSCNDTSKDKDNGDSKRKKGESRLKSNFDCKLDVKKSPKTCSNIISPSEQNDSKKRRGSSNTDKEKKEKEKEIQSDRSDCKKSIEVIKDDSIKTIPECVDSKRKCSSSIEEEVGLINDPKRTSSEICESSDTKKRRYSNHDREKEFHLESKLKNKDNSSIKKHAKNDEKRPEEKKQVKFDDKKQIKFFERDEPEPPPPTLAECVKARRKSKKAAIDSKVSSDLEDTIVPALETEENTGKKRKIPSDERLPTPKVEVSEKKSPPVKNEKSKGIKESEKGSKKKVKSNEASHKTKDSDSEKVDVEKQISSKKNKLFSITKSEKSESSHDGPVENIEPPPIKKKKSKSKEGPFASKILVNGIKEEREEAPIVLTFKSADITNISPPRKKEQKNHVYDKVSTKMTKKSDSKRSKKQSKKNRNKLIVSFKDNQSFQPKKKKSVAKEEAIDNSSSHDHDHDKHNSSSDSSKEEQIKPDPVAPSPTLPEPLNATPNEEEVKHKKKSKKKSKTKLKKHEKIVNVETYNVVDTVVVRVKKKKIYKKRNEDKVLVRIVKNHCNKSGEYVKTETIVVDNELTGLSNHEEKTNFNQQEDSKPASFPQEEKLPLKTDIKIEKNIPEIPDEKPEIHNDKAADKKSEEKKFVEKKNIKKKVVEKRSLENIAADKRAKEDSPEYFPSLRKEFSNHASKRRANFKHSLESNTNFKNTTERRPMLKKSQKLVKKTLSRPANKNVTVGGKVVGKTTKGMKKTGGDGILDQPLKVSTFEPIAQEIPQVITQVTEPKNVYNFFCRKYRPIVVRQFPKADFSEISRRLAALWKTLSEVEKQEHRDKFEEIHSVSQQKLAKLGRLSPTMWSESDLKFIKKNIGENDAYSEVFSIPKYPVKRLAPIDMAAHLSLLGDSLNMISSALQQQSSMTVHGAMSVLLDSILSALAPLVFFTSHIPEMKAIEEPQQARILDNLSYILPGL